MHRLSIVLAAALALPHFAQAPSRWTGEIDLSAGAVEGKRALGFWPSEDLAGDRLLDPSGMTAHLSPTDDLDTELVYPCGTWFSPPAGRYKFWLEGAGWMSPASSVLKYGALPFRGKGWAAVWPVVTAGEVAVAPEIEMEANHSLRLLHTESHNRGPHPLPEISRRVRAEASRRGAAMPEGRVLAGIFDERLGEYLAIAPVDVFRGETAWVAPRAPRETTDLLVVLERPGLASSFEEYDVDLTVGTRERGFVRPSVEIPTAERLYALWRGLAPGTVLLEVASPSVFLEPRAIVLNPGEVSSYRGSLRRLPTLEVEIHLPSEMSVEGDLSLEVKRQTDEAPVRRLSIRREAVEHRLEGLPPDRLEVVLRAPPWRFIQRVDLGDGEGQTVRFEPSPVYVTGKVYRGDRGHPATVSFATGLVTEEGGPAMVPFETDESGAYEALLFRRGFYSVFVRLREAAGQPFVEATWEPIEDGAELDFHIPENAFRARVVDVSTGAGIAGAKVGFDNRFTRASSGESNVSQEAVTDSEGVVDLPPLRPGELEIRVEAAGYRSAEEETRIGETDRGREVLIRLRREVEITRLSLFLAHGAPAAGAEAIALAPLAPEELTWRGRCDGEGVLSVPARVDGMILFVKHPQSGSLVRLWDVSAGKDEDGWILPEMAAPLDLLAKRTDGEPVAWARFALWIDGQPIAGSALRWLTGRSFADREGVLRARHLPMASVKVLAWAPTATPPGLIEALAADVGYPWADMVEVEAIQ